ncbi:DNA topoisomerase IB [soil metagenome]
MTKNAQQDDQTALPGNLNHVDDRDPGITRKAGAKGFFYRDADGERISDEQVLKRIKALAIPPAWRQVWICPDPKGHIQAVGRDAKWRKQYRYHPGWRASRDRSKYDKMFEFGRALPRLRARVEADLALHGLPRDKVLAAVVRLLELTLIRVGNDAYAKENKSFGLTTLRMRHVELGATGAVFEFRGKSGVSHKAAFRDRKLARVVRACGDLPGQRLFQYLDEDGSRRAVGSSEVNDYLHEAMGDGFSAKDFRTWAGALTALEYFDAHEPPESAGQAKAMVKECVAQVARRLGNTPAVCRACYIHPAVIEAFEAGTLTRPRVGTDPERRLIRLLEGARKAAA